MKPKSGDRFYSERSKTGGLHASSVSFHSSALRKRDHQKQDRSLNLSRASNKKSLSRLIDPHPTRVDLHHQDIGPGELYLKTKFLHEIFLNREEQLWEDLENEEVQLAGLESNLNLLTRSVKVLKDSIMASISERCRPVIPRKSPSPGHMRLQLEDAFHDFLVSREKKPVIETCRTEVVSPKSATTNKLISLLNHTGVLHPPSRVKAANENLSMDSQARMNLSNPTITEHNFDPIDQTASISSFKRLIPCDSRKNWKNLYSGLEHMKHASAAEGGQSVFVSRLKLTQDRPETSGRQTSQQGNSRPDLQGSASYRNLKAALPSESFLTQRDTRIPSFQEATGSGKIKPSTPRMTANPMFKSTIDTSHHKVAGLHSPKSPRVESFLAKMEHLISPTGVGSTLAKAQSDLQKSRPANSFKKDIQTPKITTLKIAPHTVIYGPGKKPKPGITIDVTTPAKPIKRHTTKDSAVAPLSVIEEHSTSQVGTVMKDSPRKAAGFHLYSDKRDELGGSHSKSRVSAERSRFLKKTHSQDPAGSDEDHKPVLMSVDTGSIPFGPRTGKVEHTRSQMVQIDDQGPQLGVKMSLGRSLEKRSHKLLFASSQEDSESTQREKTSLQQAQLSDFEPLAQVEDPSISLTKRGIEDSRKGSSPGIINNVSPVLARDEFPQVNTSLEEQFIYPHRSYASPKATQFRLQIEKTDPVDKP